MSSFHSGDPIYHPPPIKKMSTESGSVWHALSAHSFILPMFAEALLWAWLTSSVGGTAMHRENPDPALPELAGNGPLNDPFSDQNNG